MPTQSPRPTDATLSVTKAARILGVHPNTIRAWSDAGRLRYYRINPRGDRRYRLGDLQRFMNAAAGGPDDGGSFATPGHAPHPARRPFEPYPMRAATLSSRAVPGPHPHRPELTLLPGVADALEPERRRLDFEVLAAVTDLPARVGVGASTDLEAALTRAVTDLRDAYDHHAVAIWELLDDHLVPRAVAGMTETHLTTMAPTYGSLGAALAAPAGSQVVLDPHPDVSVLADGRPELAAVIPGEAGRPWGVLLVVGESAGTLSDADCELVSVVCGALGATIRVALVAQETARQLHRADALRRVAGDIGGRLDLDQTLSGLVDHAIVLFEGDRSAVFLRRPDGQAIAEASRGLSQTYLNALRDFPPRSLAAASVAARRPLFAVDYRNDIRGAGVRASVVQEGFDTICTAPLLDGAQLLGILAVYHDQPHHWSDDELETMAALAAQASVAIKTAQNYSQMATWAAQLQSIQQLGARLNRLTSVHEIGLTIAIELRQLIDYHNVRVYRLEGDELNPVAMQGQVGEYVDETPEQLIVKVGEGITGWVAQHKLPQSLPDAAKDPRADTIPGTESDLDESMLLAPMIFEDQVLGVLVLSKLGLRQFSDDDLRLLVIYGNFAAQAMANADATERLRQQSAALERQLRNQRELLQITESILSTLDARAVLDQVADRLADLVGYDNIAIEIVDPATGLLAPLTARGAHAAEYLEPWQPGETGLAPWVVEHNEPVLVLDEGSDERVNHFRSEPVEGSLIVVPLRGRDGATGVLTLERLGRGNTYTEEEFDLVKLFAAQVSIALQNAEIYSATAVRARTDGLTALLNHATFRERLAADVAKHEPFSLVMLDLDDFKLVNDELGHQAGDRLLAEIARAIVAAGRESDHVFRYGGDEFALILPGADPEDAVSVAERVRGAIAAVGAAGSAWQAEGIVVSASFGVATFPADGATAESVLLAADRACFVAKRSGPGRIANAEEGLAIAAEFKLQEPTPVDSPNAA